MLKSITCEKLIESPMVFNKGLNSLLGADDAHNSIGKSSVLMLIDFAFGGTDFPSKCDDVIKNVGFFKLGIEFYFDKKYSFVRDTENLKEVYDLDSQSYISLSEYNSFLRDKYFSGNTDISFRECVSGFFRIYQRGNYNDRRPLDIVPKDKWTSIRKRVLKIFGKYWTISDLESQLSDSSKLSKDIKGTYNTGAVRKVNKTIFKKNGDLILENSAKIEEIKNALKRNVTDIKSIVNKKNIELTKEKDRLVHTKLDLELQLSRIESNLSGNKVRTSKDFKLVEEYFPTVNSDRLAKVENFHRGISKILRKQLQDEKKLLVEGVSTSVKEISKIDIELLEVVNSEKNSLYLLEELLKLDRAQRAMKRQNDYWTQFSEVSLDLKNIREDIKTNLVESISEIEGILNIGIKKYIETIYREKPILPKIHFGDTDYTFNHGDDRGTGKGFANMISLDLSFLDNTHLPCLIHDSLLFKNMDIPAVEHLIKLYSSFEKQIFITIDEVPKYNKSIRSLLNQSMFLKLNEDRLAFRKKWKSRET